MDKKIFGLLIFLFLGSLIFVQSCNDSPIMSSYTEDGSNFDYTESTGKYKYEGFGQGLPVKCQGQTPINPETRITLWGNNGEFEVGWVEFDQYIPCGDSSFDASRIHVIFHFDYEANIFPWYITQIHFHVGDKITDIPHDGNGVVLQNCGYIYKSSDTIKTGTHSFWYNLPDDNDNDGYYIFAHAVGCKYGGIEGFNHYLPKNELTYKVTHNGPNSYMKSQFLNGTGGILTGTYEGSCVDPDLKIYPPVTLSGRIYSSCDTLPAFLKLHIDNYDNFDLANWIINYYPVGSIVNQRSYSLPWTTACYPFNQGTFSEIIDTARVTWEDIQAALWAILDNSPVYQSWHYLSSNNLTHNNVWGIIYDVLYGINPNGFVPNCYQKVMAIFIHTRETIPTQIITIQPTISQLQIPCVTHCGSICGDGKYGATYPGTNNSYTYFRWDLQCSGMP